MGSGLAIGARTSARASPNGTSNQRGVTSTAVLLLEREKGAAGEEDVVAPLAERELARGRDLLAPDLDLSARDLLEEGGVLRRLGLFAGADDAFEEEAEDLVEKRARRHGVEPLGRVALELLRGLEAKDVLEEVPERALREGFEARGGLRLAARAGVELREFRPGPIRPRS